MSEVSRIVNPKNLLQLLLGVVFVKLTLPAISNLLNWGVTGDQLSWLLVVAAAVYAKRSLATTRDLSSLHTSVARLSTFLLIFALVASFLNGLGGFLAGILNAGLDVGGASFADTYLPMILAAGTLIGGIYLGFLGTKVSSGDE